MFWAYFYFSLKHRKSWVMSSCWELDLPALIKTVARTRRDHMASCSGVPGHGWEMQKGVQDQRGSSSLWVGGWMDGLGRSAFKSPLYHLPAGSPLTAGWTLRGLHSLSVITDGNSCFKELSWRFNERSCWINSRLSINARPLLPMTPTLSQYFPFLPTPLPSFPPSLCSCPKYLGPVGKTSNQYFYYKDKYMGGRLGG